MNSYINNSSIPNGSFSSLQEAFDSIFVDNVPQNQILIEIEENCSQLQLNKTLQIISNRLTLKYKNL